jgi:glutamate-5-semialdehyde dehydrogenase
MAIAENRNLEEYCLSVSRRAKVASAELSVLLGEVKNGWLRRSAELFRGETAEIMAANRDDIEAAPSFGLTEAQTDRLRLTSERIEAIAAGLEEVACLPDPIGEVIESAVRPNGLEISRVRVPLGVVFFIYESRPNVTADAAAICVKSGNAVILRGGKEAAHSSRALVDLLIVSAKETGVPVDSVQLVNTSDRSAVSHFLGHRDFIDVAIPRGGAGLIRRVVADATMPVIKHFDGNCHVYVDCQADLEMAEKITINSKCQRLGVCNACESLLIHADIAAEFMPQIGRALQAQNVEVRGDRRVCELFPAANDATDEDYAAEYLAPIISVKIVPSLGAAIEHINRFGSHHTDTIVTKDLASSREFAARVDSSAVMINASTRFNDGGEFGLGAEIGISTDKFHARGPCGLKELTSYKYIAYGNGQLRS